MGEEYAYILNEGFRSTVVVGQDSHNMLFCVRNNQGALRNCVSDLEMAIHRTEKMEEDLSYFRFLRGRLERIIAYLEAHPEEELNVRPFGNGNESSDGEGNGGEERLR